MRKPTNPVDKKQHDICVDTVKNPNKAFLGGPSADEAKKALKTKFGYTDQEIKKLEEVKRASAKNRLRLKIRGLVESVLKEAPDQQEVMKVTKKINNYCEQETDVVSPLTQAEIFTNVSEYLKRRAESIKSGQ